MLRPRASLPRDKFSSYFNNLKSQTYHDPAAASRGGGSQMGIRSISWNPLGNLVATGSVDRTVRVWLSTPPSGNPDRPYVRFSTELKGHVAPIQVVAFNPVKDSELATMSSDGVVKFWDARSKNCFNEVRGLGEATALAWAPDGESLVVGNKAGVLYILSPRQPAIISSHPQEVVANDFAFCWGGQRLFVALQNGRARILSYPELEPVLYTELRGQKEGGEENRTREEFVLHGHTSSCLSAELQPTARYLATGGSDSLIALWDTTDWLCPRTISTLVGPVGSISFTFDGIYLAGGTDEGTGLNVFHAETGELVHTFKTAGPVPVLAWAPTRYWLAYGDSGVLRIVGVDDRK